jgi:zinc and cadmium transporter
VSDFPTWGFVAISLVADGLSGLAGGMLPEPWLRKHQSGLVAFAAGAMLGAVFLDVMPQAISDFGPRALTWAFGGFIALTLLEWLLQHGHSSKHSGPKRSLPAALLVSDALHNIGDGAAVAAAFLVSPRAGVAVTLAVIAHEVPQEVGDYAVLRAAGWNRFRAVLALGGIQLTAAIGAVGVLLASDSVRLLTPAILAVAAGTFLYIGATDLLPEVQATATAGESRERIVSFVVGVLVIAIITAVL